jgi:hypothetical protein
MMAGSKAPHGPDPLAQDHPHHLKNLLRRTAGPYIGVMMRKSDESDEGLLIGRDLPISLQLESSPAAMSPI